MNRSHRLLSIYTRFMQNKRLDLSELSNEFKVSDRTIKRDIQEIRNYLYDNEEWMEKKNIYFNYNSYKYSIQEQKKPSNK
ncbi:hypothetical protein RN70_00810 [Staphylococcus schleiferi]|uniref:HTH domain-containing protein n=1 Tax=Staphylococcus coagulans TaxID=74706 RepID=UPI000679F62C|nr:hypothetical protein NP71_00750 [Staphylococcus schleiferi]MBT2830884.1 HTH domain-containing protein [Staphylococcus coagulans]AKS70417.1 hypothetical protein OA96_00640 [Staphylococcus schleiferi]AKS72567.1 hypothetical protein RN70_00810 [Staphylococcus schleiferi]MBT2832678.1 HTH domain-containing protein [Staphylococcus coagulans]